MAVVYRAQDESLKREVAVKLVHMHLSAEPESKARLEREAQAVAKLRHDNILEIYDYSGRDAVAPFIVTEFIDGETLKQFLSRTPVAYPEVAALIAAEVAGALAHAHGLGIIHRDVKPENVMIRRDGLLKLMDFGIAQLVDLQRMTVTGQLLGSPAYMAPELIEGRPLDFRTDVFSVGVLLYELATRELPFSGKNPHEVLRRIATGKFTDPRTLARLVGDGLHRIIARALARDPDERYGSMAALAEDLAEYAAEAGLRDRRTELRAFFTDPSGYEQRLTARLTAGLLESARGAADAARTLRAFELLNRLLALDPRHQEGLRLLHRIEYRRRVRVGALALAGGTALAVAAVALSRLTGPPTTTVAARAPVVERALRPVPTPLPAAPASPPVSPRWPAAATDSPAPDGRNAGAGGRRGLSRRLADAIGRKPATTAPAPLNPAPPPAPTPTPPPTPVRSFVLGPTPQNVDVYLDGVRQFAYGPDHKSLTVPWVSNHVIEFRSPSGCCFVERVEIGPDHPLPSDGVIARRLAWRPARVVITSDPPVAGARVLIGDPGGGSPAVARLGEDVDVKLGASEDGRKEIDITVDTGDRYALASDRVTVRAGRTINHVVKLKVAR